MASVALRTLLDSSGAPADLQPGQRVDAGYGYWWQLVDSDVLVCTEDDNITWLKGHGTTTEQLIARCSQWVALAMCVICLLFYGYSTWKASCGWEEVYVCAVELVKVLLEIYLEVYPPATLYLNTNNQVLWIRYGEWLLTCPVILIHLSNITGLKNNYNKRTMTLLVSDIGTIVWGVTAAMSTGYKKWIFFCLGLVYGCNTYFHAGKVYIEGYHTVPKGYCRLLVGLMAMCFYAAWTMFPILFLVGPEGFGLLSPYTSVTLHTVADILSKQLWSLMGHHLRNQIHLHILIHGNLVKKVKVRVGSSEVEVEEMVNSGDEGAINKGTQDLAIRESFVKMRHKLKQQGIDVRASLDKPAGQMMQLEPGRVILVVTDLAMVECFQQQFAQLPAPIELVPVLGADNVVQLVQYALQLGGLDFVLVHPELLKDRSPAGLLPRLRGLGQTVCAFGWLAGGPVRELIESAHVDGYLEGPAFGVSINQAQLVELIYKMQTAKKVLMMSLMSMGMGMGTGMGTGMGMRVGTGMGMGMATGMGMGASPANAKGMGVGAGMVMTPGKGTAMGPINGQQHGMGVGMGMGNNMGTGMMGMGMGPGNGVNMPMPMGPGNAGGGTGRAGGAHTSTNGVGSAGGACTSAGGAGSTGGALGTGSTGGAGSTPPGTIQSHPASPTHIMNTQASAALESPTKSTQPVPPMPTIGGRQQQQQQQQQVPAMLMPQMPAFTGPAMSGMLLGNNPLYGSMLSPLNSYPSASGMAGSTTPPTPASNGMDEAEMLQQLMDEIRHLKSELDEP